MTVTAPKENAVTVYGSHNRGRAIARSSARTVRVSSPASPSAGKGEHRADEGDGGEQGHAPEGGAPSGDLAEHRARGDADDGGEGESAGDDRDRLALGVRRHEGDGGGHGDAPETRVGESADDTRGGQDLVARGGGATMCAAMKTARGTTRAVRRGQLSVATARSGAPMDRNSLFSVVESAVSAL